MHWPEPHTPRASKTRSRVASRHTLEGGVAQVTLSQTLVPPSVPASLDRPPSVETPASVEPASVVEPPSVFVPASAGFKSSTQVPATQAPAQVRSSGTKEQLCEHSFNSSANARMVFPSTQMAAGTSTEAHFVAQFGVDGDGQPARTAATRRI